MNDFNFEPNYDFSNLNAIDLNKFKVGFQDLRYIVENKFSSWRPIEEIPIEKYYFFIIGCTSKSQFFELALNIKSESETINFHQIQYAHESDIKRYYCG